MTRMVADSPELPDFPIAKASACPFDPAPELRVLQNQTPLTRVRLWDGSTPWLVTRYADQRAVLADPRISVDITMPGYPHLAPAPPSSSTFSFTRMDDPEHARLRRMVAGSFTVKRIEAMRPAVQRIVDDIIDDMLAGPNPVDLVEAFSMPVPTVVISELLGVPYGDHRFFQDNSEKMMKRTVTIEERREAAGNLVGYLDQLIDRKRESPDDGLLSGLAERIKVGELNRAEAAQIGMILLVGGHETTTNMITLGVLALLENPGQLAAVRRTEDPKQLANAVDELLRYLHIAHNGMQRVAREDIEIAGQTVRAGEGLLVALELGNRDPAVFPGDPDRLDVQRDARRHVAFGFGIHQCLGQSLARLELQVVHGTLYQRIPTLKLATTLDQIPFKHDGFVYGAYKLPVTW